MIVWLLLLAADTSVKSVAEARTDSFAHAGAQVTTQQTAGELEAGARIEADAFDDRDASARLERMWLAFPMGPVALTLGDVHAQLGRGLALSLRPVSGVGVDVALRGAQAKLALGDVEVLALAGVANPANLDPLTLVSLSDPNDAIAGVEAVLRGRGVNVGVVSSAVLPRERILADEQDGTITAGAFVEASGVAPRSGRAAEETRGCVSAGCGRVDERALRHGPDLVDRGRAVAQRLRSEGVTQRRVEHEI